MSSNTLSQETWPKTALIAGIAASSVSFIFILLAVSGASPLLILTPLGIGLITFVFVLRKNPDLWELRAAQLCLTVLLLPRIAYHVELELANVVPLPESMSKLLLKLGGDNTITFILATLTVIFTVLFRINHKRETRIIIIPVDFPPERLTALKQEIAKAMKVTQEDIEFGPPEKGSLRLPVRASAKAIRRLEEAFYSDNLAYTEPGKEGERIRIVDVLPLDSRPFFRTRLGNWFGYDLLWDLGAQQEFQKLDWQDTPASIRSYLNRCFAVLCKTICIYTIQTNGHPKWLRKYMYNLDDTFSTVFKMLILPGTLMIIISLMLSPAVDPFHGHFLAMMLVCTWLILLRPFRLWAHSEAYSIAMMASFEARLLLEKKTDDISLARIALLEERADALGKWTVSHEEFREAWSDVSQDLTRILQDKLTNVPWEILLSKPAYERFNPEFGGELQVAE